MNSVTRISESRVIAKPIGELWRRAIAPLDFKFWTSAVSESALSGGSAAELGSQRIVTFKDGSVQRFQLVEISSLHHRITYELIESTPAVRMSAALHTISLEQVTHDNSTFIRWESEFSSSGEHTAAVVEDSRLKKKEALDDLVRYLG